MDGFHKTAWFQLFVLLAAFAAGYAVGSDYKSDELARACFSVSVSRPDNRPDWTE